VYCTRFTIVSLWIALLGYQPLTTLAQSRDPAGIRTSLSDTDPVDLGTVISLGPDSVTVKNDLFTRVFRINAQTKISRVDSSQLQVGDQVGIRCLQVGGQVAMRCRVDDKGVAIADTIEANVGKREGVITKVLKDTVYVKFDPPLKGTGKVSFDSKTEFDWCLSPDDAKRACMIVDLKVGRRFEIVGFVLGKSELRATSVLSIQDH
jgi:hypothetical protein